MSPEKLSAVSGSGWMGGTEKSTKIKQRRAVFKRPSCKESVVSKILPSKRCRYAHLICNMLESTTCSNLMYLCVLSVHYNNVSHVIEMLFEEKS